MRAIAVVGPRNSGKTSLLSLLAEALETGNKRVAILKYSQHPVERSNTDAFWFMRPGRTVIAVSPEETAVFWPHALSLGELLPKLAADVLLVEGGADIETLPRIICFGEEDALADLPAAALTAGPVLAVVGGGKGVPAPLCLAEVTPEDAEALARCVLEKGLRLDG
jgi:molybdopterin-guanine dinucleotide biosynthesis protein B